MPPLEIIWYVFVVTAILMVIIGASLAAILLSQRKFIAMQQEKLAESRKLEDALRLIPQKMVEAQEEERRRVAEELHDGISQMLASVKYRIYAFRSAPPNGAAVFEECAEKVSSDLDAAIVEVKRISHALHPKILDDLGFRPAIRSLCEEYRGRGSFSITIDVELLPERPSEATALGVFRILQEALNNIEKHAGATAVTVRARRAGNAVLLSIADDGKGFDAPAGERGRTGRRGLGLTTMNERALVLGSRLDLQSSPGTGTVITVQIPAEQA